jgi:hypothetical protein
VFSPKEGWILLEEGGARGKTEGKSKKEKGKREKGKGEAIR